MRGRRRFVPLALGLLAVAAAAGPPSYAQTLGKNLIRTFNDCHSPSPVVFDYGFFTATGPETMLTLSRTTGTCSTVCQSIPVPPFDSCLLSCDPDLANSCPSPFKCARSGSHIHSCVAGVDVAVSWIVVMKKSRYCAIAACVSQAPSECPPSTVCDGGGTCAGTPPYFSNVGRLCMCPDPACPLANYCIGGLPILPAADVVFESFDSDSNPVWIVGQASQTSGGSVTFSGAALPTSLAQARFATVPGEDYAVATVWGINPVVAGFQNCPDAALHMSVESRTDSCGP